MTRKIQGWSPERGLTESGSATSAKKRGKRAGKKREKTPTAFGQALDQHHIYRSPHLGWKHGVK